MNTYKSFLTEEEKKENRKEYLETNKDILREYNKEYYETNKEKTQEYYKEYYETKKNTILVKKKEKVTCQCGCNVVKNGLKRHERNKKHINLMNQIQ